MNGINVAGSGLGFCCGNTGLDITGVGVKFFAVGVGGCDGSLDDEGT
jgi:hypothetical protein